MKKNRKSESKYSIQHRISNFSIQTMPLNRYSPSSLPPAVRFSMPHDQPISEIYFDRKKKSKFMKNIVDGYFDDALEKDQSNTQEVQKIISGIKDVVKKNKGGFYRSQQVSPIKDRRTISALTSKNSLQNTNQFPAQKIPMFLDEQSLQLTSSTNISYNSFLPPIQQLNEDTPIMNSVEESMLKFPQIQTTIQVNIEQSEKNKQILIYENEAFKIYVLHQNDKPKYRMKQFKFQGIQILRRQQKIKNFGIQTLWQQSQISANCFLCPLVHPIKNLICRIVPNLQNSSNKSNSKSLICRFKVKSTNFRKYLLANDCLQLKHMIRQICLTLKKLEGRVLNNKINPSNLFVFKAKVLLGQWGYSSFRDQYQIQTNKFQSRVNPILKSQKQWLTTPQYLSPQILYALLAQKEEQQPDIWENPSASDIWSLGLTLFQVITMIPIWMNDPCVIRYSYCKNSRSPNKNIAPQLPPVMRPRKGFLATDDRKMQKIIEKQRKLNLNICKSLLTQLQQKIDPRILELIRKMVVFEPSQRITLQQILDKLK